MEQITKIMAQTIRGLKKDAGSIWPTVHVESVEKSDRARSWKDLADGPTIYRKCRQPRPPGSSKFDKAAVTAFQMSISPTSPSSVPDMHAAPVDTVNNHTTSVHGVETFDERVLGTPCSKVLKRQRWAGRVSRSCISSLPFRVRPVLSRPKR